MGAAPAAIEPGRGGYLLTNLSNTCFATCMSTVVPRAGPFYFLEQYAVPYLAVTSSTWITHGTLSNYMGLTASLMYGFRTPSGTQFITAGNSDAAIVGE